MLLDCLTNKALDGGRKVGWTVLVLCTQAWGAAIYLFSGHSYLLPKLVGYGMKRYKRAHMQQFQVPYISRRAPAPHTYPYYQQGYQAQISSLFDADDVASQYYDPLFELPQASYPEMLWPIQR